jgi:hypothetical protein
MAELELVTLHEDAERLVLRGPDGAEHTLAITEALRAAVRRDRPRTEALQAQSEAPLRPREMQSRLRAGATAEELAAESGLPLEHVRRYEWPVLAERDHVVTQVRAHRVDPESDTTLGDLADKRLAARDVPSGGATWSARREGSAPWHVEVRFVAGERERSAAWSYDPRGRVVVALDDEARWLGQPDDPLSPEILGVPSERPARTRPAPRPDATAMLLDDLADRRGQRPHRSRPVPGPQSDELPLDLQPEAAVAEASVVDLGARRDAHRSAPDSAASTDGPGAEVGQSTAPLTDDDESPTRPRPSASGSGSPDAPSTPIGPPERSGASDAGPPPPSDGASTPAPAPQPAQTPAPARAQAKPAGRRGGRKGRAQVPSWDEIVFGGARPSS